MTIEYGHSLAQNAMTRLNGMEKMLMRGEMLAIIIKPDGQNTVSAYSTTVSGATVEHVFRNEGSRAIYGGTQTINTYEGVA